MKIKGESLHEQTILFFGAGGAGVGIANLLVSAMVREGLTHATARERCWFVDSQGLVVKSRLEELHEFKRPYAHDREPVDTLEEALTILRPTVLIGASAQCGAFTAHILRTMGKFNHQPIIMALSNPTTKAECTAETAYNATDGRAIFASGSPFAPVQVGEKYLVPGQGNNAYIFPGVGLGVLASGAQRVTDEMFFAAAQALGTQVTANNLASGCIYPPLSKIRQVSLVIAVAVAKVAVAQKLASHTLPKDTARAIRGHMFDPAYPDYTAKFTEVGAR